MGNSRSLKVSDTVIGFLDRLRTNRRKEDIDKKDLGNNRLLETIYKYFKENDKSYKGLLKTEYIKNV